uniref:Uncharacterized protein n=1 Tax=Gorilla gorilla gorilla TaxID=9595 RepID=A0A2I2ZXK2_GORGO
MFTMTRTWTRRWSATSPCPGKRLQNTSLFSSSLSHQPRIRPGRTDSHGGLQVESVTAESPLTNQFWLTDHDLGRLHPRMMALKPPIPRGGLPGKGIFTCGLVGALQGALLCSSAILKWNLYSDLKDLASRIWAQKN